jgi:hypothetical protein
MIVSEKDIIIQAQSLLRALYPARDRWVDQLPEGNGEAQIMGGYVALRFLLRGMEGALAKIAPLDVQIRLERLALALRIGTKEEEEAARVEAQA